MPEYSFIHSLRLPESEAEHLVCLSRQKVDSLEKKVSFVMLQAIVCHVKVVCNVKVAGGSVHNFIAEKADGKFSANDVPHFPYGSDNWVVSAAKLKMIRKAYKAI